MFCSVEVNLGLETIDTVNKNPSELYHPVYVWVSSARKIVSDPHIFIIFVFAKVQFAGFLLLQTDLVLNFFHLKIFRIATFKVNMVY